MGTDGTEAGTPGASQRAELPARPEQPGAVPVTERILVVDDEPDIVHLERVTLEAEGFEVHAALDGETALAAALELWPDLIVLDVAMPGIDGVDVCKQVRDDPSLCHTAVIMVTARTMPAEKVAGLTAGADDYVGKPFHPDELVARVKTVLRRNAQLRSASPLTGLPGNVDIERELGRLVATGAPFALLHADLDNFKPYNDHYGFLRGDEAIRATARLLGRVVADVDGTPRFLGHVGGDDFAILAPPGGAREVAAEVVRAFDEMAPTLYDPTERERGWITVQDRRGALHRYPLLSISVGVVTNADRPLTSAAEASALAGELKRLAKDRRGSGWRIDRRRG